MIRHICEVTAVCRGGISIASYLAGEMALTALLPEFDSCGRIPEVRALAQTSLNGCVGLINDLVQWERAAPGSIIAEDSPSSCQIPRSSGTMERRTSSSPDRSIVL